MSSADPARSTGPTDQSRDAAGLQLGAGVSDQSLDVERDSDVPISTQIFWQIAFQIDSGRLQPGSRLPPVRELGAALRVNPNTIRAVYRRLADAGYIAETLRLAGATGVDIVSASIEGGDDFTLLDRTADLILLSREAIAHGLGERFDRR